MDATLVVVVAATLLITLVLVPPLLPVVVLLQVHPPRPLQPAVHLTQLLSWVPALPVLLASLVSSLCRVDYLKFPWVLA